MWGIREQRRALATQKLLDETSYVLEYMSRSIRMAKKDDVEIGGVTKNCLSAEKVNYELTLTGQGGIKFRNYKNECQEFFLENYQLKEKKDAATPLAMTSSAFTINTLKFNLIGASQGDQLQPRVTIFLDIQGKGQRPEEKPQIKIQTTLSQRNLDIQY